MSDKFGCENSRVQLPAVLHLVKLGYTYIPRITLKQAGTFFDPKTNILTGIFLSQFLKLNPQSDERKAEQLLHDISIHTYYYDKSILDGYTLKILREEIETSYKNKLKEIYEDLEKIELPKNQKTREIIDIKSHPRYVKELLRYIISDLKKFRNLYQEDDGEQVGGMIICDSSEQARALYGHFMEIQMERNEKDKDKSAMKPALILYDSDDKDVQQDYIDTFKSGTDVDVLIVFNMLLIGFDAPRLKPEHLIGNLWSQQSKGTFDTIFDATMRNIADENIEIFNTHTSDETKIPIFEDLTIFVTDTSQRPAFARALVDKLIKFSFEEVFAQRYDFFAAIFEYLIKDYNTAGGGKYAEYYTPHSIATIMARLLVGNSKDLHNIECYDPSAGTGTLLMALAHQVGEDKCTIYAQDISQRSNKRLKLNLLLNNLVLSLDKVIQGDTLVNPYHKTDDGHSLRKFDYVVSNPPFKMDFSDTREKIASQTQRFWAGVPNVPAKKKESMAIYTCFIQHVINYLKDSGKGADEIIEKGYVLSVGQYFDIKIEYVDITAEEFNAQMKADTEELSAMFKESHKLEEENQTQLKSLKFND